MTTAESRDAIFLIGAENQLSRVSLQPYESEALLQTLIADHPEVLAGEQIDPGAPVRWLLVCREAGIPDTEDGYDRFAVDHLLLDQNAIPTFVEVKRSTDTRIRRELVGQMLDYAANAQRYWPADRIRELAGQQHGADTLLARIVELTGEQADPSQALDAVNRYWARVEENLRNGYVRLLFVGDALPPELRRIIEFLNEQMPRVQVLGLELRQYVGDAVRALVPRLVGQTELARQEKSTAAVGKTDRSKFLAACPESIRAFMAQLIDSAEGKGLAVAWGSVGASLRAARRGGGLVSLAYLWPPSSSRAGPTFCPYIGYLTAEDDPGGLKKRLQEVATGFRESGKLSLELEIGSGTREQVERALDVLGEAAGRIASTDPSGTT